MNNTETAKRAYASNYAPIRTERGSEYDAFAKVTRKLHAAMSVQMAAKPRKNDSLKHTSAMADAIHINRKLWSLLAADVMRDGNMLPDQLRASILSLNAFTRTHGSKVLRGESSAKPLIEINTAIMRGLNGGEVRR